MFRVDAFTNAEHERFGISVFARLVIADMERTTLAETFKFVDHSGRQHKVSYEAYQWKNLIRFLIDHANGEELMILQPDPEDTTIARLFGWGYQSMHERKD